MKTAITIVLLCGLLYLAACGTAWRIRNPLGNEWTFWLYFPAPLTFERVPELQP